MPPDMIPAQTPLNHPLRLHYPVSECDNCLLIRGGQPNQVPVTPQIELFLTLTNYIIEGI